MSGLPAEWDRDHARNYIDYIDSTFTSEGHIPNMSEAEEVFPPVNPDESLNFNESRLSLGLGRLSMGSVGGYNTPIDGMRLVSRSVILMLSSCHVHVVMFSYFQIFIKSCCHIIMFPLQAQYRRSEGLRGSGGGAAPGLRDVTEGQRGREQVGPEDSSGRAGLL